MSDPKEILEEKCAQTEKCRPLLEAYQRCAKRVERRGEANTETCVEELFELQPCIDNCVNISSLHRLLLLFVSFFRSQNIYSKN